MNLKLSARIERIRSSLFFTPMVFVLAGIVIGQAAVTIDVRTAEGASRLPLGFTSTVESARAVVSTIAAATITVAGIAFSISLLVIQLASSQYSPRVVHSLFRDPTNKRLMGMVVGTFTYCLVVLRSVRGTVEDGGEPVVPNLSVGLAVVLGIIAILAILYFIDHSARSMDISEILHRITQRSIRLADGSWPVANPDFDPPEPPQAVPGDKHCLVVRFHDDGWIERFQAEALLDLTSDGGTVRFETRAGRYVMNGSPLCTVWPAPDDPDAVSSRARDAVEVGTSRTGQQDIEYGIRQLADVGIRALSPGVNDPTTAQDAIFHIAAVLGELLRRDSPPRVRRDERGRRLLLPESPTHADLLHTAFDELRRAAAPHPKVCVYLLESLHLLTKVLDGAGLDRRRGLLLEQAKLVMAAAEDGGSTEGELREVREGWAKRFGDDVGHSVG